MDFFQAQEDARRKTFWLILMMGAAVLSLVLLTSFLVAIVLWYSQQAVSLMNPIGFYFTPELFLSCLLVVGGIVLIGSLIKLSRLGRGADALIVSMGGRRLSGELEDFREQVLRNLVEETAIASGAPVPKVYVLDDESSINAFAVGLSLNDAALGFTRGCVQRLARDELEGVVAHEFSHLVHGDSRLNLKLMGVLHGITMISSLGYHMLRSQRYRSRNSRDGAALSLVGLGLLVVGYSGVFFASLIRSAVSRQREFLADASAVQYTRNTDGLADALKRIGGYSGQSDMATPLAADAAHMMFARAVSGWIGGLFSTHPPLPKRIQRLQPAWQGAFLTGAAELAELASSTSESGVAGLSGNLGTSLGDQVAPQRVGNAGPVERENARNLLINLPSGLLKLAHQPGSCVLVVYGLLLSRDGAVREKQLRVLRNEISNDLFMQLCSESKNIDTLNPLQRLPLLNIALATQTQDGLGVRVLRNVQQLIAADGKLSSFEWALQVLVKHQLSNRQRGPDIGVNRQLRNLRILFSYLLSTGRLFDDALAAATCRKAYQVMAVKDVGYISANRLKPSEVTEALLALEDLPVLDKKRLMSACQSIVLGDGKIVLAEMEMLRTIAEVLGCPLPLLNLQGSGLKSE